VFVYFPLMPVLTRALRSMLMQFLDNGVVRMSEEAIRTAALAIGDADADVTFKHDLIRRAPSKVCSDKLVVYS